MKATRLMLAMAAIALMTSCSKNAADEETTESKSVQSEQKTEAQALKVAYVDVDSLSEHYEFCTDGRKVLEQRSNNARKTLETKAQNLQQQAAQFQQKVQQNAYTQQQAEQVQASLIKQQQDLQALEERLTNELAQQQLKYNVEMHDSVQSFLKAYNKAKKYDLILSKSGDNLLWANPAMDITKEVVAGLNKRYAKNKKAEK